MAELQVGFSWKSYYLCYVARPFREWVGCFGGLASPTPIWTGCVFIKCSNKCSALLCFLIMKRSSCLISLRWSITYCRSVFLFYLFFYLSPSLLNVLRFFAQTNVNLTFSEHISQLQTWLCDLSCWETSGKRKNRVFLFLHMWHVKTQNRTKRGFDPGEKNRPMDRAFRTRCPRHVWNGTHVISLALFSIWEKRLMRGNMSAAKQRWRRQLLDHFKILKISCQLFQMLLDDKIIL